MSDISIRNSDAGALSASLTTINSARCNFSYNRANNVAYIVQVRFLLVKFIHR